MALIAATGSRRRRTTPCRCRAGFTLDVDREQHRQLLTCSGCGTLKPDLTLGDRTYTCAACGLVIDRDLRVEYINSLESADLGDLAPISPLNRDRRRPDSAP